MRGVNPVGYKQILPIHDSIIKEHLAAVRGCNTRCRFANQGTGSADFKCAAYTEMGSIRLCLAELGISCFHFAQVHIYEAADSRCRTPGKNVHA